MMLAKKVNNKLLKKCVEAVKKDKDTRISYLIQNMVGILRNRGKTANNTDVEVFLCNEQIFMKYLHLIKYEK